MATHANWHDALLTGSTLKRGPGSTHKGAVPRPIRPACSSLRAGGHSAALGGQPAVSSACRSSSCAGKAPFLHTLGPRCDWRSRSAARAIARVASADGLGGQSVVEQDDVTAYLMGDPWEGCEDLARADLDEWLVGFSVASAGTVSPLGRHEEARNPALERAQLRQPRCRWDVKLDGPAGLSHPSWSRTVSASLSSCSTEAALLSEDVLPGAERLSQTTTASESSMTSPEAASLLWQHDRSQVCKDDVLGDWEMQFTLRGLAEELTRELRLDEAPAGRTMQR